MAALRTLSAEDARGADPVVVLSHRLWERRFGADAAVAGRVVRLDGRSRTVIDVLPDGLGYPGDADLWVPLASGAEEVVRLRPALLGRLHDSATAGQVEATLRTTQAALDAERPADERVRLVRAVSRVEQKTFYARSGMLVFHSPPRSSS